MTDLALDDIDITGIDDYPPTASVKLYGPPGTGKTTQCAARVARLIEDHGYTIGDVAWATYRKSLARDTLQRLADWGVIDPNQLENPRKGATRYIGTFHAIGDRLVDGMGQIVRYYHRQDFAEKRSLRFERTNPWQESPGELLFNVFQYCAENFLDPTKKSDLNQCPKVEQLRNQWRGDIGAAWQDWKDYKAEIGHIDYFEQLQTPFRQGITPGRPILVVDEYHDAYPLMAALAENWMQTAEIVIVAGDPDQVVNDYAGADPEFFRRLDLPQVLLETTYRVPFEHWTPARTALSKAHDPPPVRRVSSGDVFDGDSPRFYHDEENGWLVPGEEDPRSPPWLVNEYGEDTMFLTRVGKQGDGVARSLEKAGILFETQGNLNNPGWGAANADDMSQRVAVYNALQKVRGLSQSDMRSGHGLGQFQGGGRSPEAVRLRAREAAAILDHTNHKYLVQDRAKTNKHADDIEKQEEVLTATDLSAHVKPEWWDVYSRGAGAVRHLNKTTTRDSRYNLKDNDLTALAAALKRNSGPIDRIATKVYTIHAAKGGEAENVVVYDGITGRIRRGMETNESKRDNEWRTWYVALTRSKNRLFVLRNAYEWTTSIIPDNLIDLAEQGRELAEGEAVA